MNTRFALLLSADPLRDWLAPEHRACAVQAAGQLLALPRIDGDVDPAALNDWIRSWLSASSARALDARVRRVTALPRRPG